MCTQRDNNPGNVYTITQAMCTQQPRQCVHNDPANGYTTTQTMFKIIPLVKLYVYFGGVLSDQQLSDLPTIRPTIMCLNN